jgi:geranylgeranyl diphosphate synthase type II
MHRTFGEPMAVLAGDGLVVLAFEELADAARNWHGPLAEILYRLSRSVGSAAGMVAGQAWELEPTADLHVYHACKTGAIFEAATVCGALAAGAQGDSWSALGRKLGQAYQAADDVADVFADPAWLGKPTGRDLALGRPSVALKMRADQGPPLVTRLLEEAMDSIPSCCPDTGFREWLRTVTIPMIQRKATHPQVPDAGAWTQS